MQKADIKTFDKLRTLIKNKEINADEKIKSVISIYNELNIRDLTENKIKEYHQKAITYLDNVSCKDDKKSELLNFALQIMKREK